MIIFFCNHYCLTKNVFKLKIFTGYDTNKYGLQSQRKFLDLSLPIRLCGLPNNATLELVKRESISPDTNVQVAVQVF